MINQADLRCPDCGETERFRVVSNGTTVLDSDRGSSICESDFDESATIECLACDNTDEVGIFDLVSQQSRCDLCGRFTHEDHGQGCGSCDGYLFPVDFFTADAFTEPQGR